MATDKYTEKLEKVIKQMLEPIKGIPFNIVIESICGHKVLEYDENNNGHKRLLSKLIKVAKRTCAEVNKVGIIRSRPNEVGNDIEEYVLASLAFYKISAQTPDTNRSRKKQTGYPDIEIIINNNQKHYIECKTYSQKTKESSMRTFYLSPSEDFKVTHDAIHFILGFEVYVDSSIGNNVYKTKSWKILDAYQLECDVKYEFNSDNKRLYQQTRVLAEGDV